MVLKTRTLSNGFDSTLLIIAAAGNQNHSSVDWKGPVGLIQSSILPSTRSAGALLSQVSTTFKGGNFTVSGEDTPLGVY